MAALSPRTFTDTQAVSTETRLILRQPHQEIVSRTNLIARLGQEMAITYKNNYGTWENGERAFQQRILRLEQAELASQRHLTSQVGKTAARCYKDRVETWQEAEELFEALEILSTDEAFLKKLSNGNDSSHYLSRLTRFYFPEELATAFVQYQSWKAVFTSLERETEATCRNRLIGSIGLEKAKEEYEKSSNSWVNAFFAREHVLKRRLHKIFKEEYLAIQIKMRRTWDAVHTSHKQSIEKICEDIFVKALGQFQAINRKHLSYYDSWEDFLFHMLLEDNTTSVAKQSFQTIGNQFKRLKIMTAEEQSVFWAGRTLTVINSDKSNLVSLFHQTLRGSNP